MTWRNDAAKRIVTPLLFLAAVGRIVVRGLVSRLAWALGVLRLVRLFGRDVWTAKLFVSADDAPGFRRAIEKGMVACGF